MTTLSDHESLEAKITNAVHGGFWLEPTDSGETSVLLNSDVWVGAVDRVEVFRSSSLEGAMDFIHGALWASWFIKHVGRHDE